MTAYGRFVDGAQAVPFNFERAPLSGIAGDCITSALWRNGVKTITRSFKYHRRRGALSLAGEDANVLLDIDDCPNVNGDLAALQPGQIIRSRHHWGGLERDRLAALQYLSPLLPPGFYYRAFYQPRGAWKYWEKLIRKLAGDAVVNTAALPQTADKTNAHCDVAVIGGGLAGIAAAAAAAKKAKRVVLLDKNARLGGAANWLPDAPEDAAAQIAALPGNVIAHSDCRVTGIFADNLILAVLSQSQVGRNCLLRLRAGRVIVATGARDIPCVFADNDLPGVMLTQAALRLAYLYDAAPGKTAVMLAATEADATAARALRTYGVSFAAVFVLSETMPAWGRALADDGFSVMTRPAHFAARGRRAVEGAEAEADGQRRAFACDCILMSGGKAPKLELPAAAGAPLSFNESLNLMRAQSLNSLALAGAADGRVSAAAALADGRAVGGGKDARPGEDIMPAARLTTPLTAAPGRRKQFIDFEEDLQPADLDMAMHDGFADAPLIKRYTTAGMGPAQGKLGNTPIAHYLAGRGHGDVQIAAPRPPASAETLAQLAGAGMHPVRHTALHAHHEHLTAEMMIAGEWLRPAVYTTAEEEAVALRQSAGVIDVSTLGKIRVRGADAAELLQRLYTGAYAKQPVGAVRYALMLDESGVIIDDGVAARLDEETFWVTTTTGNAAAVFRNMLLWRERWGLRAEVVNMTSAYAALNVAGPHAEDIMTALFPPAKNWHMRYMRCVRMDLGGAPALVMRIGFVGEKGYEIHLPAGYAGALWEALARVETPCRITPCGVQAQRLLRLEKGHIIIGQDTDGLTIPSEVGMEWAVADKPFFIGARALKMRAGYPSARRLLAFTMSGDWKNRVAESDLILRGEKIIGRVTSVAYSPTLNAVIGLAFAEGGAGKTLSLSTAGGGLLRARAVSPPFYDKRGERQK